MSKICRTCLQKTNRTFKTSQALGNFGEGSVRISVVLRFCIPELYLGLSSNPEICFSCKENLKVAYLFKKKCLETENRIGNFLKDVRCTGKSVELHDVLAYLKDGVNPNAPILLQEVPPPNNSIAIQDTVPDLEDPQTETADKESSEVIEVRQSAPNSTNQGQVINLSDCPNLIFNQFKLLNVVQNLKNKDLPPATTDVQAQCVSAQKIENCENKEDSNNLCKISSVFSLNAGVEETTKSDFDSTNFENDSNLHCAKEETVDIKEEPLDIDSSDNFKCISSDEDTLDASETAAFDNPCSPGLQEFIDSIPEINHPDQYVDVPDFVTINNFGFKELEEFKLQQVADQTNSEVEKKTTEETPNLIAVGKSDTVTEGGPPELKIVKVLSNAPDVIIFNGKRMVKCGNKYKLEEEPLPTAADGNSTATKGTQSRRRYKRKIKIVPVGEQPAEKKTKLDVNSVVNVKTAKTDNKDVVVLFTNYTSEGDYINDHDYLVSPYRRNKVLIEEDSQWLCMCFICNTRHDVFDHVKHMSTHDARCMVCFMDLGTPYMLNIHCKAHKKPCRYCTEILPYGLIKSHEQRHDAEEERIVEGTKKGTYSVKRGRKKMTRDEKPVYFQLQKQDGKNSEKCDGSQSLMAVIAEDKTEIANNHSEDLAATKRQAKGRYRRKIKEEDASEIVESPRTLRERVKRWYTESEDEDEGLKEEASASKGTSSDLKGDEK